MTEELCRAKFEEWWRTQRKAFQFSRVGSAKGPYHSKPVQQAWNAWKAAWNTRAEMEKSDENA